MSKIVNLTNQLEDDVEKANIFVHGDENATYPTKDGARVRSIRNLQKEAKININDAEVAAANAEKEAKRSEAAAAAAQIGANLYPNIKIGLSATKDGEFFNVVSKEDDNFVVLMQNSNGEGLEVKRYPSADFVLNQNEQMKQSSITQFALKNNLPIQGVLWAVVDALNNRTWLEISDDDGGMTDLSQYFLEKKLGFKFLAKSSEKFSFSLTDKTGVATDLTLDENGMLADFVIEGIRERIYKKSVGLAVFGSSTFQEMHPYFSDVFEDTDVESFFLGGDSGAVVESIAARMGCNDPQISFSDESIVTKENIAVASWYKDKGMREWSCTLSNGVKGSLKYIAPNYVFIPKNIIAPLAVEKNGFYKVWPTDVLDKDIFVINVGKNNIMKSYEDTNNPEYIFNETKKITDFLTSKNKKFVVLGHFVNRDQPSDSASRVLMTNNYLQKEYGFLYFDLQNYLCSEEVWVDTAVIPTADDIAYQKKGELAVSLSRNEGHMNPNTSQAVCAKIKEHLINLEYISEK